MDQLQIICICSLRQNNNLLKQKPKPLSSTEAKELALGSGGNTASRLLYPPQKQSLRLTLAWLSSPRSKFSLGTSEFMN